jgi:hypothetical protein
MLNDFIAWLDQNLDPAEGGLEATTLKELLASRRAELESSGSLGDVRVMVEQHARDRGMPQLLDVFDAAQARWAALSPAEQKVESPSGSSSITKQPIVATSVSSKLASIFSYGGAIGVGLFSAFLLFIIWTSIANDVLLHSLADIAVARGLITFFFTLGTIGISVVMIAGLFLSSVDQTVLKQRFDSGKEILTALIAILGTVVGFYFGSQSSDRADRAVELQPIQVSNAAPKAGETLQLSTFASGGDAPYRFSIDFQWTEAEAALAKEMPDITNKETPSGFIAEKIAIPAAARGKTIPYTLVVTDAANRSVSLSGEKLVVAGETAVAPTTNQQGGAGTP